MSGQEIRKHILTVWLWRCTRNVEVAFLEPLIRKPLNPKKIA